MSNMVRNLYKSLVVALFIAHFLGTDSESVFADELEGDTPTLCNSSIRKNVSTPGVCVSIKKHLHYCAPLYKIYSSRKWDDLREHFCVPKGSKIAKVCCPLESYTKVPIQPADPDFKRHRNYKLLPINECGKTYNTVESKIIGGFAVNPGDFPWLARIGFSTANGHEFYACSGTIISKRYILTAAHCFKNRENILKYVQLAESDEDVEYECIRDCIGKSCPNDGIAACSPTQEFETEEVIIHEGYQYRTGSVHDIALIRLKKDINITNWFTRPICLPFLDTYNTKSFIDDEKLIHKKGYVAGWGKTSNYDQSGSSIMKYVSIPMVPVIQCQLVHRQSTITKSQLCAGGVKGKDTCSGDSGSPFMYFAPTKLNPGSHITAPRYFQVGIVSYGRARCGTENVPVVYTRVRSYLGWILDHLKP